jgi:hypothetical protein
MINRNKAGWRGVVRVLLFTLLMRIGAAQVKAQSSPAKPGLEPYAPTRVEWLALWVNSQVRSEPTRENPFDLRVVNSDHETILIYVRYEPTVNRRVMNMAIDTTRKVIAVTAKGYGWESWVRVKEDVGPTK